MGATVIQAPEVETVGAGVGEGLHQQLEHLGLQRGECQEEALAGGWGDGAIDREPFDKVLDGPQRLDPTGREPTPASGQSSQPAFVLADDAHGAGLRWWHDALSPLLTRHRKLPPGLRVVFV
jgi:hypothetical protein